MRARCSVKGCPKTSQAKGLCPAHYMRMRRNGSPLGGGTGHGEPHAFIAAAFMTRGEECALWPFATAGKGYPVVKMLGEDIYAHRFVCEMENGPPPTPRHEAAHSCGKSGCVNPDHLRWATPKENAADKKMHGTDPAGERHGSAKLTEDEVTAIRRMRGISTQAHLAKAYGVSASQISSVQTGRTWSHLE